MQYEWIIFDLDGTLTDPKTGITKSAQRALRELGVEVENPDTLCHFIGPPLRETLANHYGFDREACERGVKAYREYFSRQGMFENLLYPGIEQLLRELKQAGCKLYVATLKPTVFSVQILEHFGVAEYFDLILGSGLDGSFSQKSELIAAILEQARIPDKARTVMVGDTGYDILGAKEAGVASIGCLYGYGSEEELRVTGADRMVRDVAELGKALLE